VPPHINCPLANILPRGVLLVRNWTSWLLVDPNELLATVLFPPRSQAEVALVTGPPEPLVPLITI
jgi:hypothetical protein